MRYLIVNADDFGLSAGVNRGIFEAHRRGVVTSTSLMVNRPGCDEAVALARELPELDLGLHLDFDDVAGDAATLVRDQFVRFERLLDRPPTHVDGHRDAHLQPRWEPHVLKFAARCGVPVRGRSPVARLGRFYGQWGGRTHLEQVSVQSLVAIVRSIGTGVTELICHPGHVDASLQSGYGVEREAELAALCDGRVREALWMAGIRLVGFRHLPGLLEGDSIARDAS